ncbi:hypothetical protein R80B4_03080 [Fibrobacteres bacterium R8-0-B4]
MRLIARQYRTLLLSALSVCLMGCRVLVEPYNAPADTGGWSSVAGGTNCTSAATCKQVTLGTQTWMAENLNILTADSWCYLDSADFCAKNGRLYSWEAAKSACPSGWRLPDTADWRILVEAAGGEKIADKKLKSTSGWDISVIGGFNGTDEFGFNAVPSGYRIFRYDGNYRYQLGSIAAMWWMAAAFSFPGFAQTRYMISDSDNLEAGGLFVGNGASVRCIAD